MVSKIKLDFSKVEERSGWNSKHIPEGLHRAKVTAVQETEAQDGTPMLVFGLVPSDVKYKTRNFPYYCKLQQNQLWKLRDLLVAAGVSVPKKASTIDPNKAVGKEVVIEVEDDMYNGNLRSQIQGVYDLTLLEDASPESDSDEDEDEAIEDEDDAEDEDLEDDEDGDEDEDDFDEEDEDDFDEEDDEDDFDEEEPAPKRRVSTKKAAPATAPAKRAVKRR